MQNELSAFTKHTFLMLTHCGHELMVHCSILCLLLRLAFAFAWTSDTILRMFKGINDLYSTADSERYEEKLCQLKIKTIVNETVITWHFIAACRFLLFAWKKVRVYMMESNRLLCAQFIVIGMRTSGFFSVRHIHTSTWRNLCTVITHIQRTICR